MRTRVRLPKRPWAPCGLPMSFLVCGSRPSRCLGACPVRTRIRLRKRQRAPCGLPMSFLMCGGRPCRRFRVSPVRTRVRLPKRPWAPCGLPMSFLMCGGRPSRRLGASPVRTRTRLAGAKTGPRVGCRCRSRCAADDRVDADGRAPVRTRVRPVAEVRSGIVFAFKGPPCFKDTASRAPLSLSPQHPVETPRSGAHF